LKALALAILDAKSVVVPRNRSA